MRSNFPTPSGSASQTPMVYVRDKIIWQYKVISPDGTPSEEELNSLGKGGWELTAVLSQGSVVHFYFKRMKDYDSRYRSALRAYILLSG
jgi:hypothetical protein